jgi:hypothetical protein
LRLRVLKAPHELRTHQHLKIVQPCFIQGQDLCRFVTACF